MLTPTYLPACLPCRPLPSHPPGSRLRRDLLSYGGVAPVASTTSAAKEAAALMGGMEEKFAFARAVSRLYEMQSPLYRAARPRRQ